MKKILLLILCLVPIFTFAQTKDVKTLLEEAESSDEQSPGAVLVRWLRVYDAAQEEDPAYLSTACLAIGNMYSREDLHQQALPYYLEALDVLSFDSPDGRASSESKWDLYKTLGDTYAALEKPDSTLHFYNKILTKVKKENDSVGQINTLQEMVTVFTDLKDYRKALGFNISINKLLEQEQAKPDALMRNYNNLGYNYNQLNDYENAILFFEKAIELSEKKDLKSRAVLQTNIGIAYSNLKDFKNSIKYLKKARKKLMEVDIMGADQVEHLMTSVYLKQKDFTNALDFSKMAEAKAKKKKNHLLLTDIYYTSALIHSELYEYDEALVLFQKHLELKDSFGLAERIRRQDLIQQQIELERTEKQLKIFMINEEVQELTINQLTFERKNQELALQAQRALIEAEKTEKELLMKENGLKASQLKTKELESEQTNQALEIARQRLITAQKDDELNNLAREKEVQRLELLSSASKLENEQREKKMLEANNQMLEQKKELSELELSKQEERTRFIVGIGGLMALLFILAGLNTIRTRRLNGQLNKKNKDIEEQKEEITLARNKSDQLLLNILPAETANELKENGYAIPKSYENATVLFTDFSGFTAISALMTPEDLVKELNLCFQAFDEILERYGMEKIKTIGDAYMCVSGVPSPDPNHAIKAIMAGKAIVSFMNQRIQQKEADNIPYWKMRMGIHSGPVVAGVVGTKKFAYDIWGNTVNIASRMETNGEPGKINISEATYQAVKKEFRCSSRGEINAKNLGEVGMYFVEMGVT